MDRGFRRAALAATLLLCPLASGCLIPYVPVGWGWPTASVTPVIKSNAPPDEVRAFRIDVHDDLHFLDVPVKDEHVMNPISPSESGWVFPEVKLSCDYGWAINCIALG